MMLHHRLIGYRSFGDVSQTDDILSYTADRTSKLANLRDIKRNFSVSWFESATSPVFLSDFLFPSEQATDNQ